MAKRLQALLQRDAARREPCRRSKPSRRLPTIWSAIRRPGARAAEAIAAVHGLNPATSCAATAPTNCLGLLCHAYLGPGDEGIITEHGFLVRTRSRSWRTVRRPSWSRKRDYTRRCRRDPCRGDGEDQDRLHRQSRQSDRHLYSRRAKSAACRPACRSTSSSCSMRPMRNMFAATTMKPVSRSSRLTPTSS